MGAGGGTGDILRRMDVVDGGRFASFSKPKVFCLFFFWRNGVRTRLPSLRKIYPSLILLEKGASIQNGRAFFVLVHLAGKKGCFFLYFFYKKLEMDG